MSEPISPTVEKECLVCRSERMRPIFIRKGIQFLRCPECGLIYQEAPPSPAEARAFYEKNYYEAFGGRTSLIQQARLPLFHSILSGLDPYRVTGKILDVGSGFGDFLEMAEAQGWEAWGIEPSRQAGESAQRKFGERVLIQTIESTELPQDYFDAITLWNVVDCLPDPVGTLKKIWGWLRPGGLVLIRTPNAFFHLGVYRFYTAFHPWLEGVGWKKEASVFLRANFDAGCLKKLLAEAGFSGIRIGNGKPTEGDPYQVSPYSFLVRGIKFLVYQTARLTALLSGRRILIGSNLIATATKQDIGSGARHFSGAWHLNLGVIQARIILKGLFLHSLAVLGYLLGFPVWFRIFGKEREIRVLRYHGINEFRGSDLNVQASQFRRQLGFLQKNYSVISLEEAVAQLRGKGPLGSSQVVITFDDGYEDNYHVAFPILKAKKLPATVFLLTEGEGPGRKLSHLWKEPSPYDHLLQWDQVREMQAGGIEFGSHGRGHVCLRELSTAEIGDEVLSSKAKIESEISQKVRFFSYPYGTSIDFDPTSERSVREAGYEAAFSALFGGNRPGENLFSLRRIGIEASDTLFTFRAKLNGALYLLTLLDLPPIRKMIRGIDSLFLRRAAATPKRTKALLLVTVDFPPHKDGISTISRELSGRIARRGKPVYVIGPKSPQDEEFDRAQSYRVFRAPGYEWGWFRFIPLLFWTVFVVIRYGIREIFGMSISYGGILAWGLSLLVPMKYIVFAHGYEFEKVKGVRWAHRLYLMIFERAEKVIANSRDTRERLLRFGVSPEKIEILHPAVGLDRYRPCEVPPSYLEKTGLSNRLILLTVGRLIERKGHDRVIESLPEIIQTFPNVLYGIVGVGPEERILRQKVHSLGLEDYVRFMGKVSDEELLYLYNACKTFVMPSREIPDGGHVEGFGIVYLEANACGKPVIGGRSGGIGEAIREGETGFLVDPNSPHEIAEKVIFLLSHPEEAEAIGKRGLEWAHEAFDTERYVEQAYRFLRGEDLP